jgi:DNA-nicking Smr family endonuclease
MGQKRKKNRVRTDRPRGGFSHRPFAGISLPDDEQPPADSAPAADDAPDPSGAGAPDDDALALERMAEGAEPLDGRPLAELRTAARPLPADVDDTAQVMRELDELVQGSIPFDFADTEEFIEAAVQGLDRRILRRLRRGELAIQAHLDLHGYNRAEARQMVGAFVDQARSEGKRCVLIVHGRGLGSKDNIPVLKQKLAAWLTRGAIGRKVLAYSSARPYDGGAGAVYVLLRG